MFVYIYIYIYIYMYLSLSISLSLSIYIYIYIHMHQDFAKGKPFFEARMEKIPQTYSRRDNERRWSMEQSNIYGI